MMNMNTPRLIFWELTKRCNLRCRHCRAEAEDELFEGELDTGSIKKNTDDIASFAHPILVLTGGEPLYREDIFDIAAHAKSRDFRLALATNGTLIDKALSAEIARYFDRTSISIDGKNAESHDGFRGMPGSFENALNGARLLREAGAEFQFNTTVTKRNVDELENIVKLSEEMEAKALHIFMLVPVGCGIEIAESEMLSKERYEETLHWLYDRMKRTKMEFKATCAPPYYRVIRQKAKEEGREITFETDGMAAMTRGCLAGSGVCFISHRGDVQPCGYLPLIAGNVNETNFRDIWKKAPLFLELRDLKKLKGKCGVCEFKAFCAGCRARAYYETGDYMEEEPYCVYIPKRMKGDG